MRHGVSFREYPCSRDFRQTTCGAGENFSCLSCEIFGGVHERQASGCGRHAAWDRARKLSASISYPVDPRFSDLSSARCSFTCHVRRLLVSDSCLTHAPRGCRKYSLALRPRSYSWRRLCIGRATQREWAAGGSEVLSTCRCLDWLGRLFCLSPVSVDLIATVHRCDQNVKEDSSAKHGIDFWSGGCAMIPRLLVLWLLAICICSSAVQAEPITVDAGSAIVDPIRLARDLRCMRT